MKLYKFLAICAIALFVTSCGSVTKTQPYSFDQVRLEMNMNDLVYLGEDEVSVEYSTYLFGLIKKTEKVNGETYNSVFQKKLDIPGCPLNDGDLQLATYKLVEQYPDADYFQVVFKSHSKDKLFLGDLNKKTAKVKAYKLKK